MALIIGVILLFIVLGASSVEKSVNRAYDQRHINDKKFCDEWAMDKRQWCELMARRVPGNEHHDSTVAQLREIYSQFPDGERCLNAWLVPNRTRDILHTTYFAMYDHVGMVMAALHGKLPYGWNSRRWRAAKAEDEVSLQFTNALYKWWLVELQRHGFPYTSIMYVDHYYDKGIVPNTYKWYFERQPDIGNDLKSGETWVEYFFASGGTKRFHKKLKQAESAYFESIGVKIFSDKNV